MIAGHDPLDTSSRDPAGRDADELDQLHHGLRERAPAHQASVDAAAGRIDASLRARLTHEDVAHLLAYLARVTMTLSVDTAFAALASLVVTLLGERVWAEAFEAVFARPIWQRVRLDRAWGLRVLAAAALDMAAGVHPGLPEIVAQLDRYAASVRAAAGVVTCADVAPMPESPVFCPSCGAPLTWPRLDGSTAYYCACPGYGAGAPWPPVRPEPVSAVAGELPWTPERGTVAP